MMQVFIVLERTNASRHGRAVVTMTDAVWFTHEAGCAAEVALFNQEKTIPQIINP